MVSIVPKSFLFIMPLQIGAEIICGLGIFNRASGFYGFLSLFTGHPLSALEWILNLLSMAFLPLYVLAFWAVKQRNALFTVLFAYVYSIDTIASVFFTTSFSVVWFSTAALSISENHMMAGNKHNLNSTANGTDPSSSSRPLQTNFDKSASLASETAVSMIMPIGLLMLRLYFSLIILAYARLLVRQHNLKPHNGSPKGSWNAKLQKVCLSIFQQFWYGGSWVPAVPYKNEAGEEADSFLGQGSSNTASD